MFQQTYFPFNFCFHVKQHPSIRVHFTVLYFSPGTHTGKQLMRTGKHRIVYFDLESSSERQSIARKKSDAIFFIVIFLFMFS
jgi:hypothetical protein